MSVISASWRPPKCSAWPVGGASSVRDESGVFWLPLARCRRGRSFGEQLELRQPLLDLLSAEHPPHQRLEQPDTSWADQSVDGVAHHRLLVPDRHLEHPAIAAAAVSAFVDE